MSPPTSEAPELGGGGGFRAETAVTGSRSEPADCAADSPAGPTASELTAALRAAGFSVGVAGAGFVVARWHYVRRVHFRVAQLARLVDLLVRQADVGGGCNRLPVGKPFCAIVRADNLPPFLRRVHFRVAQLARLVDLLVRQADVGGGCKPFPHGRAWLPIARHLAPYLRRVVLVGQAHRCAGST